MSSSAQHPSEMLKEIIEDQQEMDECARYIQE